MKIQKDLAISNNWWSVLPNDEIVIFFIRQNSIYITAMSAFICFKIWLYIEFTVL